MQKILLVQPNYSYQRKTGGWGINPPLGLCYVASVYEKAGIEVKIIDANVLNLTPLEVVDEAIRFGADAVGVSILTPAHEYACKIAELLPRGEITSIAGGPHASACPDELKDFDVVYQGDLGIECLPARHLLIANGVNKPYYSAGTRYFPWAPVITSFGCPYDCYYCNKKTFGYKWRSRNAEDVADEITMLVDKYGVREIDFYDDCFNMDIERAEKILAMIRRYKLCLRFSNGLRIDKITKPLLAKMKEAGTEFIAYGIESGNQAILDRIPKQITLEQIRQGVAWTKEAGIEVMGFFMLGLLGDTVETMQDTINFAKSLNLDYANFSLATPYPGTKMWDMVKAKGKINLTSYADYQHQTGKCLWEYPDMATPTEIEQMYRLAFRSTYLTPQAILKQALKINSWDKLKVAVTGLKRIMYSAR
jgi:radical SAM superfamily enzyme YgiQ (UPF0313 family)